MEENKSSIIGQLAIPGAIIIAGIIVAVAIIFSGGIGGNNTAGGNTGTQANNTGKSDKELLALAKIQPDDWVRGDRNSKVYILEFSDPECPFCKQFHQTMHQVMSDYGGQVTWVYRNFPLASLHPKAPHEAQAIECAGELGGNDKFWAYADRIYEVTPSNNGLPETSLPEIATYVGLDATAFQECLDSGRHEADVNADFQQALDMGGTGTPFSFLIANGTIKPILGAQPYSVVKGMIDTALGNGS